MMNERTCSINQTTTTASENVLNPAPSVNKHDLRETGRKNLTTVWRDDNVYRLLIKETLYISAHQLRLNRTIYLPAKPSATVGF